MKRITPILIISLFITTSCSDIFEKQLDIYKDATKELKKTDDFTSVMNEAINTEVLISQLLANATDEEREELKEDYGEDYGHMLDSIETVRNKYYSDVDSLFLGYTYNFVERRTLLYQIAADRYCKAEYIEELNVQYTDRGNELESEIKQLKKDLEIIPSLKAQADKAAAVQGGQPDDMGRLASRNATDGMGDQKSHKGQKSRQADSTAGKEGSQDQKYASHCAGVQA